MRKQVGDRIEDSCLTRNRTGHEKRPATRGKPRAMTVSLLLGCAMIFGAFQVGAATTSVQFLNSHSAHNLYLLNEDGNLFRWGEPRYGSDAGSRSEQWVSYLDSVQVIPPSPSGAPWKSASGNWADEVFLDQAGHAYFNQVSATAPSLLIEISHSGYSVPWRSVCVGDPGILLIDEDGHAFTLRNAATPIQTLVPLSGPSADSNIVEAFWVGSGILVRTADGDIYGSGWNSDGVTGTPISNSHWSIVQRPSGVNRWEWVKATAAAGIAMGDNGVLYYWGRRVPGSILADPATDARVPVPIPPPDGVSDWINGDVSQAMVSLLGRDHKLYFFGIGPRALINPSSLSGSETYVQFSSPAQPVDPSLMAVGPIDDIRCGFDYILAQTSDGNLLHWGRFMRMAIPTGSQYLPVTPMKIPDLVDEPVSWRLPAARMLTPVPNSQLRMGEPVNLSAEVFPLQGSIIYTEFVVNGQTLAGPVDLHGSSASETWVPKAPGIQHVSVKIIDSYGQVTESPTVNFETYRSVTWAITTNHISEPTGNPADSFALVTVTRTEMPYPNYENFSYRFQVFPGELEGKDFRIIGATPVPDNSNEWELDFVKGQTAATFQIEALQDDVTDVAQSVRIAPSSYWADLRNYLPPVEYLNLEIDDTTPAFSSSSVMILNGGATIYAFEDDVIPLTISVLKSLTDQPVLELYDDGRVIPYQQGDVEDLADRWLFHCRVAGLVEGLHPIRARVRDGALFNRYRDSWPVSIRVWNRLGLPNLRVLASNATANEASGQTFAARLVRDGDLTSPLEVDLNIRGTAINGTDYDLVPNRVTIPAGASYVQFPVVIRDDNQPEIDEDIIISARQSPCDQLAGCYATDTGSEFRVKILDDDRPADNGGPIAQVYASPFAEVSYLRTASGQLYAWGENTNNSIGLGTLPAELAIQVPWPRHVQAPFLGGQWQSLVLGANQVFALSSQRDFYAWGRQLAVTYGAANVAEPTAIVPDSPEAEPFMVNGGHLYSRSANGQLLNQQLDLPLGYRMYRVGDDGLPALLKTSQNLMLSEDGYFHQPSDWAGNRPEVYPRAADAGYWRDAASSGEAIIALDELERLYQVEGGAYAFDPEFGLRLRSYTSTALPTLTGGRSVTRLFGNERAILALATDGSLIELYSAANGLVGEGGALVPFPDGVTKWLSVAAGQDYFLAIGDDGNVYGWGDNSKGQLGDGTNDPAEAPRRLPAFASVTDPDAEFPTVNAALPPRVVIENLDNSIFLSGPSTIKISAHAFDPDGLIDHVEFLIDGEVAEVATFNESQGNFAANLFFAHPGDHVLTARAWDDSGLSTETDGIVVEVDDPGLHPVVHVWNVPSGSAEGYGDPGYFIISRQGVADVPLTVYFEISGTATEGVDYPALPRSVVIPAGAAEVKLPVIALPDFVVEPTEEVDLTIVNPGCDPLTAPAGSGCYKIGEPATAPEFIIDYLVPGDARLPVVSVRSLNLITREGSTNVARVEFRRTGSIATELPVHYSLGGEAQNGIDYAALSGSIVIPAGQATTTVEISAIEDSIAENFERVIVSLDNPGCDVGQSPATDCYRIADNSSAEVYIGDKVILPPPPPGLVSADGIPRPVLFKKVEWIKGQGAVVTIISDVNAQFTLEASPDMVHWTSLGNYTSANGYMELLDVNPASKVRFYRVRPATSSP
ncbi:hypothetical protein GC207_01065 [bacterium]|nr:hypothetical protein [bacterium]